MARLRCKALLLWLSLLLSLAWCAMSLRSQASYLAEIQDVSSPNVSLLCFTVVRPRTAEVGLVHLHIVHKLLAGCDRYFIFSNESLPLNLSQSPNKSIEETSSVFQPVIRGSMDVGLEGYPADHPTVYSVKNTRVFLQAWSKLFEIRAHQHHDWVVKVDPDTIVFPDRLRLLLKDHDPGKAIGIFDGGSLCRTGMGGLAVLSRRAVEGFLKSEMTFMHMPVEREDGMLMAAVRLVNGVVVEEPNLLLNPTPDCATAPWKAAYHPQKYWLWMEYCYTRTLWRMPPSPEQLHTTCL